MVWVAMETLVLVSARLDHLTLSGFFFFFFFLLHWKPEWGSSSAVRLYLSSNYSLHNTHEDLLVYQSILVYNYLLNSHMAERLVQCPKPNEGPACSWWSGFKNLYLVIFKNCISSLVRLCYSTIHIWNALVIYDLLRINGRTFDLPIISHICVAYVYVWFRRKKMRTPHFQK